MFFIISTGRKKCNYQIIWNSLIAGKTFNVRELKRVELSVECEGCVLTFLTQLIVQDFPQFLFQVNEHLTILVMIVFSRDTPSLVRGKFVGRGRKESTPTHHLPPPPPQYYLTQYPHYPTLLCLVQCLFNGGFQPPRYYNMHLPLSEQARNPEYNVQHPAAEDGGGAAEERGQHQENLCFPGCGGHQGQLILTTLEV